MATRLMFRSFKHKKRKVTNDFKDNINVINTDELFELTALFISVVGQIVPNVVWPFCVMLIPRKLNINVKISALPPRTTIPLTCKLYAN